MNTPDRYVARLESWMREHANMEQAGPMEAYMRGQFPFLGIKSPERKELTRAFIKEHGVPQGEALEMVVRALWRLPEREFQYVAMTLLEKRRKETDPSRIELLEELILAKSWWDTVDWLASHGVGAHLASFPEQIPGCVECWMASWNLWLQRTAILFQLGYKRRTDTKLLFRLISECADSKEFFIRKAIGWALREYSKTDENAVRAFVAEQPLSPLSVREALKVVNGPSR
ncbi:DNA alkylation repair protein [Paenibacillus filicis]|uniref:DNA alkylation repair protein n=1 Tax=Paenibacillus gyeongsangnamensis TaxID=3388067 RepID=A0ABT4Q778_9BACL|nr:DNA alkylation repair protein [Paenibacillus filicis]MCZ8512686.1 DNA alkylation repair protein [Paenibacillus filicis]